MYRNSHRRERWRVYSPPMMNALFPSKFVGSQGGFISFSRLIRASSAQLRTPVNFPSFIKSHKLLSIAKETFQLQFIITLYNNQCPVEPPEIRINMSRPQCRLSAPQLLLTLFQTELPLKRLGAKPRKTPIHKYSYI